jgi:secreted trypsin-like serine protease
MVISLRLKLVATVITLLEQTQYCACSEKQFTDNNEIFNRTRRGMKSVEYRIIDGEDAETNEYPYFVQVWTLTDLYEYEWNFCGGTLIHPKWILTAAHCVLDSKAIVAKIGYYNLKYGCDGEDEDPRCYFINPDRAFVHPEYDSDHNDPDFALLDLGHQLSELKLIPLVNQNSSLPNINSTVTVVGLGVTEKGDDKNVSNVPQDTNLVVVSRDQCQSAYDRIGLTITDTMLCTTGYGKTSSCYGDSGGPLVLKKYADGRDLLVGVVSMAKDCASERYPSIYGRVSAVYPWIISLIPDVQMQ